MGRPTVKSAVWLVLALLVASGCNRERSENERNALRDVVLLARAEERLHFVSSGYIPPETLIEVDGQRFHIDPMPARFIEPLRAGYRFTFEEQGYLPPDQAARVIAMELPPAFAEYSYTAVPVEPGHTGQRSFAYFSRRPGVVFVRQDGQPPTPDDEILDVLRLVF